MTLWPALSNGQDYPLDSILFKQIIGVYTPQC